MTYTLILTLILCFFLSFVFGLGTFLFIVGLAKHYGSKGDHPGDE